MCSYLTEETFSGIFVQGICISSRPLKAKGCFVWYICKDVHTNVVAMGGHFLKIMKDSKVTLFLTLIYSICKTKCPRYSVQVYTTNILYIFT